MLAQKLYKYNPIDDIAFLFAQRQQAFERRNSKGSGIICCYSSRGRNKWIVFTYPVCWIWRPKTSMCRAFLSYWHCWMKIYGWAIFHIGKKLKCRFSSTLFLLMKKIWIWPISFRRFWISLLRSVSGLTRFFTPS